MYIYIYIYILEFGPAPQDANSSVSRVGVLGVMVSAVIHAYEFCKMEITQFLEYMYVNMCAYV